MKTKLRTKPSETIIDVVLMEFYKKETSINELSQMTGIPEQVISRILSWSYRSPYPHIDKFYILESKINRCE